MYCLLFIQLNTLEKNCHLHTRNFFQKLINLLKILHLNEKNHFIYRVEEVIGDQYSPLRHHKCHKQLCVERPPPSTQTLSRAGCKCIFHTIIKGEDFVKTKKALVVSSSKVIAFVSVNETFLHFLCFVE